MLRDARARLVRVFAGRTASALAISGRRGERRVPHTNAPRPPAFVSSYARRCAPSSYLAAGKTVRCDARKGLMEAQIAIGEQEQWWLES
jgi:hypothetical protein